MSSVSKWIDQFLCAMDDGKELAFIKTNSGYITQTVYKEILLKYMEAVHEAGPEVEEKVQDYVKDELSLLTVNL